MNRYLLNCLFIFVLFANELTGQVDVVELTASKIAEGYANRTFTPTEVTKAL